MVDITEMMENHTFAELLCNVCNELLSVPPILIDGYGKHICGRCESDVSVGSLLHDVYFETLAHQFQFPCRFSSKGCKIKTMFNKIQDHEETCPYQIIRCGVKMCQWSGFQTELIIHHYKYHGELVIENNCLEKKLLEDRGCFMLTSEGFYFLVEWSYCDFNFKLKVKNLHLSVLHCDIICNYSLSILNLEKAAEICGSVKLNKEVVAIIPDCNKDSLPTPSSLLFSISTILPTDTVNKKIEALNRIVCSNCSYTMIPPILKCPEGHLTCIDCSDNNYDYCQECGDDEIRFSRVPELEMLAASVLYRCKWKDCGEDFSIREIEFHQRICTKRLYICPYCPHWQGLLNDMSSHIAVCTSPDYIYPLYFDSEITIPATVTDWEEYSLVAHNELFYILFTAYDNANLKVAVCNCGPSSLFGWYCYEVALHHTELLNFPFNKKYILKNRSNNRYSVEIPFNELSKFGERELCKITVKIKLLSGSEKILNVAKHFRWLK